jgi:hypothetical protein
VEYDAERVHAIKDRFFLLDKAILAGKCPKRPYERDSIKCSYCRFQDHCWEGVPIPAPPAFLADETVEKPEMELVTSAAETYVRLKDEEQRIKDELEMSHKILMNYFRSTGNENIPINGNLIMHSYTARTELDAEYLMEELGDAYRRIATPQAKLIQGAIKAGLLDAEVYERAKKVSYIDQIRIKKGKGGDNANQTSE